MWSKSGCAPAKNEAGIATTRKTKKSYAMLIDFDPCRRTGEQKVKHALYAKPQ
jgi:hypothetical protein